MIAYFDCFSGISGDMALGALLDAGLSVDELRGALGQLPLEGFRLRAQDETRHGLAGKRVVVQVDHPDAAPRRGLSEVLELIEAANLPPPVSQQAGAVFQRLARAEARVHGEPVEAVRFHELGAVDAIVDVVGTVWGLHRLGVREVYSSPLPLGGGMVASEHGLLPAPAPATLELLAEVGAPIRAGEGSDELVTPTGAALLAELARFERPGMSITRLGYGLGGRELAWPNALRLWLGEPLPSPGLAEDVVLLEANLDDMTPEQAGYVMERLLEAGALDVFFTPIQMKKSRPALLLGVLARPPSAPALAQMVLEETSSLGVRYQRLERLAATRVVETVQTPYGPARVKVKLLNQRRYLAPEFEDAARIARQQRLPLAEVYDLVRALARGAEGS